MDLSILHERHKVSAADEIIDPPPSIAGASPETVTPPRVDISLIGVKMAKRVDKPIVQLGGEVVAFFIGEAGVVVIGGRIFFKSIGLWATFKSPQ